MRLTTNHAAKTGSFLGWNRVQSHKTLRRCVSKYEITLRDSLFNFATSTPSLISKISYLPSTSEHLSTRSLNFFQYVSFLLHTYSALFYGLNASKQVSVPIACVKNKHFVNTKWTSLTKRRNDEFQVYNGSYTSFYMRSGYVHTG